ncbi:hypothetical protein HGRIS_013642 [Hohenbuehelia grisea]|uniref:Coenzyme Q-binding protein COQ10 START domain-containing protein n=1 Tax=Hohenbuehelia grisea TaxID=104357 RepID=A0ABR3IWF7_9AGAR
MISLRTFGLYVLLACPVLVSSHPYESHLPPATPGIFKAEAYAVIDAPIDKVWEVLLDFPSYPKWNPFARKMVITNMMGTPLEDQTPRENARLRIEAQIPPMKRPVNENQRSGLLSSQTSMENVTLIDHENYICAWQAIQLPPPLLAATRYSALSVVQTPDGPRTLYESREIFGSVISIVLALLMAGNVQKGFEEQALALKELLESS